MFLFVIISFVIVAPYRWVHLSMMMRYSSGHLPVATVSRIYSGRGRERTRNSSFDGQHYCNTPPLTVDHNSLSHPGSLLFRTSRMINGRSTGWFSLFNRHRIIFNGNYIWTRRAQPIEIVIDYPWTILKKHYRIIRCKRLGIFFPSLVNNRLVRCKRSNCMRLSNYLLVQRFVWRRVWWESGLTACLKKRFDSVRRC